MTSKLTRALPSSQRLLLGLSQVRRAPVSTRDFQRVENPGPAPWVIEECFKRVKATSVQYGIVGTIKYKCYLPMKSLIFGLTGDQQAKLDLYNQHQLLLAGIQKVEKACKKFLKAERATNVSSDQITARQKEYLEAGDFICAYNDLIALATKQSSSNHISEAIYLQDLHRALGERGDGLIFRAVNRAKAKYQLGNGICSREATQALYQAFVSKFIDHVKDAAKSSGSTDLQTIKTITQAFIEGLASFSELDSITLNLENLSPIDHEIHARVGDQRMANEVKKQDRIISETNLERALLSVKRMRDIELYPQISALVDPAQQPDPIHTARLALLADDGLLGPELTSDEPDTEIETI